MKIKFKSCTVKRSEKEKWHEWFAWYPVRLDDNTLVWLEKIVRKSKFDFDGYTYEYKSIADYIADRMKDVRD